MGTNYSSFRRWLVPHSASQLTEGISSETQILLYVQVVTVTVNPVKMQDVIKLYFRFANEKLLLMYCM